MTEPRMPGDIIKEKYDSALKAGAGKLWSAIRQVGPSGFGKGALIAVGLAIAAMAVTFGFGAAAGELFLNGPMGAVPAGIGDGIMIGIGKAFQFIGSKFGIAAIAAGGFVGAAADVRKEYTKLSAMEAERLAIEYENARELQKQQSLEQARTAPLPEQHLDEKLREQVKLQTPPMDDRLQAKGKFSAWELKRDNDRNKSGQQRRP